MTMCLRERRDLANGNHELCSGTCARASVFPQWEQQHRFGSKVARCACSKKCSSWPIFRMLRSRFNQGGVAKRLETVLANGFTAAHTVERTRSRMLMLYVPGKYVSRGAHENVAVAVSLSKLKWAASERVRMHAFRGSTPQV